MRWLLAIVTVAFVGACSHDLSGVGGGQILEFRNDLRQPVTFLYCPQQGCTRPLSQRVAPGAAWRTSNQSINDAGSASLQLGHRLTGCKLVEPVGVLVEPLHRIRATEVRNGLPYCTRPAG